MVTLATVVCGFSVQEVSKQRRKTQAMRSPPAHPRAQGLRCKRAAAVQHASHLARRGVFAYVDPMRARLSCRSQRKLVERA
jgi:hypothetical protein